MAMPAAVVEKAGTAERRELPDRPVTILVELAVMVPPRRLPGDPGLSAVAVMVALQAAMAVLKMGKLTAQLVAL